MTSRVVVNKKLITSKVSAILRNISNLELPIKIEEIAKARGIQVTGYPLGEDVSGMLAIKDGKATIAYNQDEAKVRNRFTIAHELGHFELHKDQSDLFVDKQFIYRSQFSGSSPKHIVMEQEANAFASAILMPSDLLRKEIQKIDMNLGDEDSEAIKNLAELFEVSPTAMFIRVSGLGLF